MQVKIVGKVKSNLNDLLGYRVLTPFGKKIDVKKDVVADAYNNNLIKIVANPVATTADIAAEKQQNKKDRELTGQKFSALGLPSTTAYYYKQKVIIGSYGEGSGKYLVDTGSEQHTLETSTDLNNYILKCYKGDTHYNSEGYVFFGAKLDGNSAFVVFKFYPSVKGEASKMVIRIVNYDVTGETIFDAYYIKNNRAIFYNYGSKSAEMLNLDTHEWKDLRPSTSLLKCSGKYSIIGKADSPFVEFHSAIDMETGIADDIIKVNGSSSTCVRYYSSSDTYELTTKSGKTFEVKALKCM